MKKRGAFDKRRIAAFIMAFMMIVVMLSSAFFITFESHHDCCGEGCHVCDFIEQCVFILRHSAAAAVFVFIAAAVVVILFFASHFFDAQTIRQSAVTRKVRLNE